MNHRVALEIEFRFLPTVRLFEDEGFKSVIHSRTAPSAEEVASDDLPDRWADANLTIAGHTRGTAKMGLESDPEAIVEQRCRGYGVEGLAVIDASVMPDIPRANTNATTIMIAERAAAFFVGHP